MMAPVTELNPNLQREVGRLILNYSHIQDYVFELFESFARLEHEQAAMIFRALPSDTKRQELMLEMAEWFFMDHPAEYEEVAKVFRRIDQNRVDRNDAAHGTYGISAFFDEDMPDMAFVHMPAYARKKPKKEQPQDTKSRKGKAQRTAEPAPVNIVERYKAAADELAECSGKLLGMLTNFAGGRETWAGPQEPWRRRGTT